MSVLTNYRKNITICGIKKQIVGGNNMKLQLGEIRNMKEPMGLLLDKELPIKVAWSLTKFVKILDKELSEIEEFRINLVKRLGEEDKEGALQVPDEKMEEFIDSFNELLMTEIEVDFETISVESLGDIQTSTKELLALDKIFN